MLVGARPRGPEWSEVSLEQYKVFFSKGKAINEVADDNIKVVVVGNPANTNALVCLKMHLTCQKIRLLL